MKNRIIHLRLLFLFLALFTFANISVGKMLRLSQPVTWKIRVEMTSPTEGVVLLNADIANGWHLYGTELPENGPIPTTIDFDSSKGVEFTDDFTPSPEPEMHTDVNFGIDLKWWTGNVVFTRNFKLTGAVDDAEIIGSVKFMSCNDETCQPPHTEEFNVLPLGLIYNK